jgi:hypothetical protein
MELGYIFFNIKWPNNKCIEQVADSFVKFENKGRSATTYVGCNKDCSSCEFNATRPYQCVKVQNDWYINFDFNELPKIHEKGYYGDVYLGKCSEDKLVQKSFAQDEICMSVPSEIEQHNKIYNLIKKEKLNDIKSARAYFDRNKNSAVTIYYDSTQCRGNIIQQFSWELDKCIKINEYDQYIYIHK